MISGGVRNSVIGNTTSDQAAGIGIRTDLNVVQGNSANRNSQGGIGVGSGSNNVIQGNMVAQGTGGSDLFEVDPVTCPNTWQNNIYLTDNEVGAGAGPGAGCVR